MTGEESGAVASTSWMRDSLEAAVQRAFLIGAGLWQFVVVAAIFFSSTSISKGWLLLAEAVLSVLIWGAVLGRVPRLLVAVAASADVVLGFAAATDLNSVFAFAVDWSTNLLAAFPVFVLSRRLGSAVALISSVAFAISIHLAHPEWGSAMPRAIVLTMVEIVIASWIWSFYVGRYADAVDVRNSAAESERQRSQRLLRMTREMAEDRRVLHDTVINTLGSIAMAGAATTDPELVRARCRHDLQRLDEMTEARADIEEARPLSIEEFATRIGFSATVVGLDPDDRARQLALLPAAVLTAMRGACYELVLNAAKHSGCDHVTVAVTRRDDELVVEVIDEGRGMDGGTTQGSGLRDSVLERAAEVGIRVTIDTAPGKGVRAELAYSLGSQRPKVGDADDAVSATITPVSRLASFGAGAGVVLVGIVIELGNHPGRFTSAYAMLALVAVVGLLAWVTTRHGKPLPLPVVALTVVSVAAGFVLAFGAVDYGRSQVTLWQAIGIVPLLVILDRCGRRGAFLAGGMTLAATVIVMTVIVANQTPEMASIVVVGVVPAIGLTVGWRIFMMIIESISHSSAAAKRALRDAEAAALGAVDALDRRRRWADAGLVAARRILSDLAAGDLDPQDPATQRLCAREEQYLREVTMMGTRAVRLSPWLTRAFVEARSKGVSLTLRVADDIDARNDDEAVALGTVVLDVVAAAPPEASLNVGFYSTGDVDQVMIVGPAQAVERVDSELPNDWHVSYQDFSSQCLLEITWPTSSKALLAAV